MKLTKYSQLRHGMKVTCKIEGTNITDAKLSKDRNGEYFICQNEIGGANTDDKLGYKYAWWLALKGWNSDKWGDLVTDLESVEETPEEVADKGKFFVGQRIWYDGDDCIPAGEYTIVELDEDGWPRIKKGSDIGYRTTYHCLYPEYCRPIEEKKDKETSVGDFCEKFCLGADKWVFIDKYYSGPILPIIIGCNFKPAKHTLHTKDGDKLEENRITIDGKEYTPDELKTLCNRYRSVLAAHSKYFPPVK